MRIHELMTEDIEGCKPQTDLAAAAMIMWRRDCGIVPVLDENRRVLGVITDRDICMAAATRHLQLHELTAGQVMSGQVLSVGAEDEVHVALDRMRDHGVRRLPVLDSNGRLRGMVSLNDVVRHARANDGRPDGVPTARQVLSTLQGICRHPAPSSSAVVEQLIHA